jgi:hypothetical protein
MDQCEYLVSVKWIRKVPQEKAKWRKGAGLRAARRRVASLSHHKTREFLEREFNVNFEQRLAAN